MGLVHAVRARIAAGTLRGIRVGTAWALMRYEVLAATEKALK